MTITVNSGPHKKLTFIGHDSADAYDKQAGKVGACVETADLSDAYRSLLPEFHEKAAVVLAKSGVARGVNTKGTEAARSRAKDASKVEDIPETYTTYANRVKVALESGTVHTTAGSAVTPDNIAAGKAQWAELDTEIHAIAAKMECDSSPSARQKGPDKGSLAKAEEILARGTDGIEAAVTKLSDTVPEFALERDEEGVPEKNSLARMIMAWQEASL